MQMNTHKKEIEYKKFGNFAQKIIKKIVLNIDF